MDNLRKILRLLLANISEDGLTVSPDTQIGLKELALIYKVHQNIILAALRKMKSDDSDNSDDFNRILKSERKAAYEPHTVDSWTFYIPFYVEKLFEGKVAFRILDNSFGTVSLATLQRFYGKKTISAPFLQQHINVAKNIELPQFFLKAKGKGGTFFDAWSNVDKSYETLCGLFEFVHNRFVWSYSSDWYKPRLRSINPPWLIGFNSKREFSHGVFVTENIPIETLKYPETVHNVIKKLSSYIRSMPDDKDIATVISNMFFLYRQAMITRYNYDCFLKLWQILESIFLGERFGGQAEKILEKLIWLSEDKTLFKFSIIESLKSLKDKRNSIVHKGEVIVSDDEINLLKYVCESTMNWILSFAVSGNLYLVRKFDHLRREDVG